MRVLRCLATVSLTLLSVAFAKAAPHYWADRYISSHGHCESFPMMLSTRPLDKPIEDWTDLDLADLKAALDRCDALPDSENGGGSRKWTVPVYRSVVENVRERQRIAARENDKKVSEQEMAEQAEAGRQRRIAADKQATAARLAALQRAAEAEAEERKAAEARTAAMSDEVKAAAHLAEETEARAKAARAEAQARYGVEAARRRATEAEEQARAADAQARADRQEADQRFAAAHPNAGAPTRTQEKAPPPSATASGEDKTGAQEGDSQTHVWIATTSAVTKENYVACKMLNELITSSQAILRGDGDTGAALVNAGECFLIDRGTRVRVKSADVDAEDPKAVCVGIGTHSQCLWVPTNILEEASR